jgi:hypothetical protein
MGFLCVPLGSSTVQLYDSLGSRRTCARSEAGFSSQNAWVYYRRAESCCAFLWAKWPNAKDIHKEMFSVYGWKCLSPKVIHNWLANVSLMRKWVETEVRKWLRQESGDFYAADFDALVKRWSKCINTCWWRIRREINVSSRFEYHMFYVLYPFVACLLTLPRTFS